MRESPTAAQGGFLDIQDFPRADALAERLKARHVDLLIEGAELFDAGRFVEWPESINRGGWRVFGVKWQGELLAAGTLAHQLIEPEGDFVVNAGYSLMLPGAVISPHEGYTGEVLRMHLGLAVPPDGDCALIVGGERREWRTGEVLLFNDTIEHSAHNLTNRPRLVFLLDVRREAS